MSAIDTIRKALRTALPNFATSGGSIEQKIIEVVGTYADSEAIERQNTLDVINKALATQKNTSIDYYRRKAVAYQENDTLVFDPVNQGACYETIDPNKQIIKQAYIAGEFPLYVLRVTTSKDNGEYGKLTPEQLVSFTSYFEYFQPLGLRLPIQSEKMARIKDEKLTVYILNGYSAGNVALQINQAFRSAENILRTTNTLSVTELSDIIQSVKGVKAVSFSSNLRAIDTDLSMVENIVKPSKGIFYLTDGAFTFDTEVTVSHIQTLQ